MPINETKHYSGCNLVGVATENQTDDPDEVDCWACITIMKRMGIEIQ